MSDDKRPATAERDKPVKSWKQVVDRELERLHAGGWSVVFKLLVLIWGTIGAAVFLSRHIAVSLDISATTAMGLFGGSGGVTVLFIMIRLLFRNRNVK
jgi:hypothetical protein